jgi:hypothetical protein
MARRLQGGTAGAWRVAEAGLATVVKIEQALHGDIIIQTIFEHEHGKGYLFVCCSRRRRLNKTIEAAA